MRFDSPCSRGQDTRSPLRVAIVAPPWYAIPPEGYGGIEAMVYGLAEGLVALGHDVTVIGAGSAATSARFLSTYETPPSERIGEVLPELVHAAMAGALLRDLDVDVVHDHCAAGPLTAAGRRAPTVATVHGPMQGDIDRYFSLLAPDLSLVAISGYQRARRPDLPWVATVHNAIPADAYPFAAEKEDFCLFLGRMSPEKGPEVAIRAAREAGCRLVLAGKCTERIEQEFFDERVRPLLGRDTEWLGQVSDSEKKQLFARARCLVFPVQWDEPFGMVMVEAMACGTPVVALRRGAVPEVVEDGVTGFVCGQPAELATAIAKAGELEPKLCRQRVLEHFDLPVMARGYEAAFRQVAAQAR